MKKNICPSQTHAKLFVQWLQGTRCNSESSAWPILQFLTWAQLRKKGTCMIDRTCLLMSFAHVCSPWINEGSEDAICILLILRNTTFSWIRLGELPLPSGRLETWLPERQWDTVQKSLEWGKEWQRRLLRCFVSLSLSLTYTLSRRNEEHGDEGECFQLNPWLNDFQVPDARCHFSAGSWTCSSSPLSWSSYEN